MNPRLRAVAFCLFAACCSVAFGQAGKFREAAESINQTIRANHYRPAELDSNAYRLIEADVLALGEKSTSASEFMNGFNALWRNGPFSHVALRKAEESAADRIQRIDTEPAGKGAVALTWNGSAAILTVTTMNGADTIEAIDAAYVEIVARKAQKLIIDLRRNGGGAFAVVPLVGHLIDKPFDAGVFVVGTWYANHQQPPGRDDLASATPWRGYSVKAFQADVLTRPLTSYRIDPLKPRFEGPVVVLTSSRSFSAAEIAADALKSTGLARIVGEKTPGAVLSSKLFDIPGGFHLRVPIADYYSIKGGRLEGVGVTPDIPASAEQSLAVALGL
ncbi:MAG TPA: S41 family peptidase [Steroidobacteraceae bacterium]|nr:S41 family peptidase [Steroidobacteraceae bacterium]